MSGTLLSFCASLDTLDQLVLVARTTQEEETTTIIIVSLSTKYNYYEQQHTILHVVAKAALREKKH